MEFRDALKSFRNEAGITQTELAAVLHINTSTVARWESGRTAPNRSVFALLMEYANVRSVSKLCIGNLRQAFENASRTRFDKKFGELYAVEHASLRELIDEAAFPLYVFDMETDEILYLNTKAEEMLGCGIDELPGRKCYECLMHRDTPCAFCHKKELVADHFTCYEPMRLFDGESYRVQGKRIKWNGREAQVMYLAKTDTGSQLRSIVDHMNGGVSVAVYSDGGEVRLAYANERYYTLFGYTKDQFQAELKDPHDTLHPEDYDFVGATIANVKSTGRSATFRYRIIKRDGSVAFISCSSSVSAISGLGDKVLISVLTDITSYVEAEQQTLVLGHRLDAIMKNITNAVTAVMLNGDGTVDFLFLNALYYEMLGYTMAQYQAEVADPFRLVYPEDADAVRSAVMEACHVGDAKVLQYRVVCRDGRIKWLRARLSVLSFPDQERPVQLAVYADITDMAEANERIAAQRDRISEMVNAAPSGIAVIEVDPNDIVDSQRIVYYNDRFFQFSGYSREEYGVLLKRNQLYFAFDEDVPALRAFTARICAGDIGQSEDVPVRCRTKDGGYRWLLLTGLLVEKRPGHCMISISQVDITERKKAIDRQRISEEMLRIAAENDKRALITYDVKANACHVESRTLYAAHYGEMIADIPQTLIDRKVVASDSAAELCAMFERIRAGEERLTVSLQLNTGEAEYQWFECNATTVFDADGQPDHAVLVFHNITEQRIKEAVFKKWQHSIEARPSASFTLFRCNMSRDADFDEREGELLKIEFSSEARSFNVRTKEYVDKYVYAEDCQSYSELMNADSLLSAFYRGNHTHIFDYREACADGEVRWRRLTVELVEYMNSTDVQAFLLYEDIDEEKRRELKQKELAETDPLTGTLNRGAFSLKVDSVIARELSMQHVLLMIDIDGIPQVNDSFGHSAGDQALIDSAAVIRSFTREGDYVCRLEGGKFLALLRDLPYDAVVDKKARQMCELLNKSYSREVRTCANIGIAVYPRDGRDFDELYHNADKALHTVRAVGLDHYAFFSASVEASMEESFAEPGKSRASSAGALRRRMLIVDDSELNRIALKGWFEKEYLIETASNGEKALTKLRHFGSAISIVLLDLSMPGMDGFEVLQRMQNNVDLRTIPVIVVSGDDEYDSTLRAIECGAADFVTKPVEPKLIRLRVQSAVSRAENERLRAQNSYLQLQRDEEMKFRTVLESTGTVVVEYDWHNKVFRYDNNIGKYIAGDYSGGRALWTVFLTDMVADSLDVKDIQKAVLQLASDRRHNKTDKLIMLKTPAKEKHWFRINIFKQTDDFGLADKLILTLNDVHVEILADEKLRYQATRDELTGLYNRNGFFEKATELIADKNPGYYVLTCVDIEKFRVINDQYGTEKGDEVLRRVAATLTTLHGAGNDLCCRVSADNFAMLYPASVIETPELIEARLAACVADSAIPQLRFTIGRCVVDDKSLAVSAIYDRAYLAKDSIKGRYDIYVATYDETMRTSLLQQQRIISQMNLALASGQFETWLQPQYNHSTGALTGAEALVRWRHPEDGLIPPNEFIPIFERNGFVYEVDKFVWESCCAYIRRWLDAGWEPVPISVNISRYDIFRDDITHVLTGLIAKYALPVEMLRLEVTESAFAESAEQIISVVKRLIALGFTVEIDDFGSGYSSLKRDGSLAYLRANCSLMDLEGYRDVVASVVVDITEQRELSDRFKAVVDNINGGVSAIYLNEGKPEYVIVNDQYYELLGYTKAQFETEVDDAFDIVHPDDRARIRAEVQESLKAQGRYTMEYRIVCRDKSIRHILCTTNVIRLFGVDTPVQLSVINDVTAEMEAKEQLKFLNDSAHDILAQPDSEKAIQDTLTKLMAYFDADRGYVIELDNATMLSSNTYEVCADGVSSQKDHLRAIPFARSDYWYGALSHGEYYVVTDANKLNESEAALKELLASQGIRSVILAPLFRDGVLIGFVGVDNPGKAMDQVNRLTAMSDYIAILITRRDLRRDLQTAETKLLDNLPHGAALYEYDGKKLSVIHLNKRYWQLVEREPMDYREASVFDAIHPDDIQVTYQEIEAAVRQGRNASVDIRVRHGADGYMPFHISANIEKEGNGKYLLYTSYIPISEQTMSLQELLPIALSAIMASSPDMSYIKDKDLRYICASPSAVQTAGCVSERDMVGRTDFELFGEALGKKYLADDTSVMKTGKPLVNDHDQISAADGVMHDIITSKFPILDAEGHVIGLYGVSRDITETRKAESELKLLSDSIPGGILSFELGPDGLSALYFNEGFFRVSGYTREEYAVLTEKDPLALVYEDDRHKLMAIAEKQLQNKDMDITIQRDIRCRLHDGSYRWYTLRERGTVVAPNRIIINAVLFDIDERKKAEELLRVSEEEYRLAAEMGDHVICRYSIADSTVTIPADIAKRYGLPELMQDVPYGRVRLGRISPDTADDFIRFYESIRSGEKEGSVTYRKLLPKGWRWFSSKFKAVFGDDGEPVSAVVSFADVIEQREKELAFAKWRQMLLERPEDSYTLFTCDIENVAGFDKREGKLLKVVFEPETLTFDERTAQYVRQYVYEEDREPLAEMLSVRKLMEKHRAGAHNSTMEFREKLPSGEYRWLRLTVDLMKSPTSDAVEGHLLFEDIDVQKRAELLTQKRSETDPLTGVLNRTAFISRLEDVLSKAKEGQQHALFMLDVDNFKQINDTLGHDAGDHVLQWMTEKIRTSLRQNDLIGRLGGDEFFFLLVGVPNKEIARRKAKELCEQRLSIDGSTIEVTASMGIAMVPGDGADFDTLYKKVDAALYRRKAQGKNGYQFVTE